MVKLTLIQDVKVITHQEIRKYNSSPLTEYVLFFSHLTDYKEKNISTLIEEKAFRIKKPSIS